MALFPTNGPAGFPIGTDVTLNLAKKRAATASSTEAPNYPKGAVDGYVDDSGRWKSASVAGPHTLTVTLLDPEGAARAFGEGGPLQATFTSPSGQGTATLALNAFRYGIAPAAPTDTTSTDTTSTDTTTTTSP